MRPSEEWRYNSPWNTHEGNEPSERVLSFGDCPWNQMVHALFDIAAKFAMDMDFSTEQIAGMLRGYESDHQTGMPIEDTAAEL